MSDIVERLRVEEPHYECEDCWYSCHLSPECCDDRRTDKCTCGADHINAERREAADEIERLRARPTIMPGGAANIIESMAGEIERLRQREAWWQEWAGLTEGRNVLGFYLRDEDLDRHAELRRLLGLD